MRKILVEDYQSGILESQFFPEDVRYGEAINDMISICYEIEWYLLERLDDEDNDEYDWKEEYEPGVMAEFMYELEKRVNMLNTTYPSQHELYEERELRDRFKEAGISLSLVMGRAMRSSGYIVDRPEHGTLEYALSEMYQFMEELGDKARSFIVKGEYDRALMSDHLENSFFNVREAVDSIEGEAMS